MRHVTRHSAVFLSTVATVSTAALLMASLCVPTMASAAESSESTQSSESAQLQTTSNAQIQQQNADAGNNASGNSTATGSGDSVNASTSSTDDITANSAQTGTSTGSDPNVSDSMHTDSSVTTEKQPANQPTDEPRAQSTEPNSQSDESDAQSDESDVTAGDSATGQSQTSSEPSELDPNATTELQLDELAAANKGTIPAGEYTITAALNANFVLDVHGGSSANGANVQIYRDNASPAQRWKVTEDETGYLTLTNEASGKVLDVHTANNHPGANVDQWASNGTRAQKWIAINENGHITLRSALAGDQPLALDVWAGHMGSGVNVQSYAANGTAAQQWNFEKIIDMSAQVRAYWNKHLTLGRPTAVAETTPNGMKQTFQHGVTYQTGNSVISVSGDIYAKWSALGGENSKLGMPTSDVRKLRNGLSQSFQSGQQIHWSASTGAHVTGYGIQNYWSAQGWENGWLGYPTGDEITNLRDGGASQRFQGGVVFWSHATNAHGVGGGILNDYAARRYEAGQLGYPINEEHDWNKGRAQDFQHGTLTWNGCGKKGWQNPAQYFQVSSCDVSVPANGMFGYASSSRISMSATRQQAIEAMISRVYDYLGTRYVWDYALQPGVGVDCAGLVMQSLYAAGMDLHEYNPSNHWYDPWHSHDANNMAADGRFKHVSLGERQRGDLIYWPGHIAIYLGNDQIIEANVPAVRINSIWAYGTPGGALRPFV